MSRKFVIAADKFKGSLDASQVCQAIKEGVLSADAAANVVCLPMADGGEGTAEAITTALRGDMRHLAVHDPLLRMIDSAYGLSSDGKQAFIEMARASGLLLLKEHEYDCCRASSLGTGELIKHALDQGVESVYLGIGGSATNDAGLGMLSALGFDFFDANHKLLEPNGASLNQLKSISSKRQHPRIKATQFILMNDVLNPLYGDQGAAKVFARQKGANDAEINKLDAGLRNFSSIVQNHTGQDLSGLAGAGAGGGIAAGAVAFLGATIQSGAQVMIDVLALEDEVSGADLVITGEGKVDDQTLSGKVVYAVLQTATAAKVPKAILCGVSDLTQAQKEQLGYDFFDSIMDHTNDIEVAMHDAYQQLKEMAYKVAKCR